MNDEMRKKFEEWYEQKNGAGSYNDQILLGHDNTSWYARGAYQAWQARDAQAKQEMEEIIAALESQLSDGTAHASQDYNDGLYTAMAAIAAMNMGEV